MWYKHVTHNVPHSTVWWHYWKVYTTDKYTILTLLIACDTSLSLPSVIINITLARAVTWELAVSEDVNCPITCQNSNTNCIHLWRPTTTISYQFIYNIHDWLTWSSPRAKKVPGFRAIDLRFSSVSFMLFLHWKKHCSYMPLMNIYYLPVWGKAKLKNSFISKCDIRHSPQRTVKQRKWWLVPFKS